MSVRTFFTGLSVAFAAAWLFLLIGPYGALADLRPIDYDSEADGISGTFPNGNRPHVAEGSQIFLQEGCTQCHTQLIRPEYLGNDTHRKLASGSKDGSTAARQTHPLDFLQVPYAPLGVQRIGPDLANVGVRKTDPNWHLQHLYAPQSLVKWSVMPSYKHLFELRRVVSKRSENALNIPAEFLPSKVTDPEEWEVVPSARALALVDYILQLRLDEPIPVSELSPAARQAQQREAE